MLCVVYVCGSMSSFRKITDSPTRLWWFKELSEKPCGAYFFAFFEKCFVPILTSGGYVGLSIATLLSQHHQVTAVDIIPEKVDMINNRKSPIQDDYIEKYLAEKELNLTATLDAKAAYSDADFVVIAAPTNYDSHTQHFDTSAVEAVIKLQKRQSS